MQLGGRDEIGGAATPLDWRADDVYIHMLSYI
jgi:hypothetical protein